MGFARDPPIGGGQDVEFMALALVSLSWSLRLRMTSRQAERQKHENTNTHECHKSYGKKPKNYDAGPVPEFLDQFVQRGRHGISLKAARISDWIDEMTVCLALLFE